MVYKGSHPAIIWFLTEKLGGLVYNSSLHEACPKEYRFRRVYSLIRQEKSEMGVVIYEGSQAVTPYSWRKKVRKCKLQFVYKLSQATAISSFF